MRRKPLALTGVAVLTAALLTVNAWPAAWAAETTGTLGGHLNTAGGVPAVNVRVTVFDDQERNWLAEGYTDTSGAFVIPDLPAGNVKVNYERSSSSGPSGRPSTSTPPCSGSRPARPPRSTTRCCRPARLSAA